MEIKLPFMPETADRFDALYQYLNRKYSLEERRLDIAGHPFTLFTVKNLDALIDELILADPDDVAVKDERLPYWAEIWPASLALSEAILTGHLLQPAEEVIEIGCGLGLAGMAAKTAGARVLLTDYQPDALRMSELNWLLNFSEEPATALMDWRQPEIPGRFDTLLASDVAYEERFFQPLIEVFKKLLKPGGQVLLSEPNRSIATKFFDLLAASGFFYERRTIKAPSAGKPVAVSVYQIRRNE